MKYFSEFIQKLIRSSTHHTSLFIKFQGSSFNSYFYRYFADKIASIFFQRAITQERGIIMSRKKYVSAIFS